MGAVAFLTACKLSSLLQGMSLALALGDFSSGSSHLEALGREAGLQFRKWKNLGVTALEGRLSGVCTHGGTYSHHWHVSCWAKIPSTGASLPRATFGPALGVGPRAFRRTGLQTDSAFPA